MSSPCRSLEILGPESYRWGFASSGASALRGRHACLSNIRDRGAKSYSPFNSDLPDTASIFMMRFGSSRNNILATHLKYLIYLRCLTWKARRHADTHRYTHTLSLSVM